MLDYDDMGESGHPGIVTIPVALAVGQRLGGVSGREFLTAVAAGTDVMTRLTQAITVPDWTMTEGWFATQLFGFIAGAVTAGRLLHLDEEQMENAIGIAFNQMSAPARWPRARDPHALDAGPASPARARVIGGRPGAARHIGSKDVVEGRYGIFRTYIRGNDPDGRIVEEASACAFHSVEKHGFKVWPGCAYTRTTNASTLYLREAARAAPEDVESITIRRRHGGTQQLCEPSRRSAGQGQHRRQVQHPFTTAVMMAKGNVTCAIIRRQASPMAPYWRWRIA
jgi:2-methylcitrate dehydratase PrpD